MSITKLNNLSISAVTALPSGVGGKVLQVVQATSTSNTANATTTYANTNLSGSITPSSASNKILVIATQTINTFNSGGSYSTGLWKIIRTIGATTSDVTDVNSTDNGNIFAFDYGSSGINVHRPTSLIRLDSPNTTSSITYRTQIAKGTNGGNQISTNDDHMTGTLIMMEIAG